MKFLIYSILIFSLACNSVSKAKTHTKDDYQSLFDGKTLTGWRMAQKDSAPGLTWAAENGVLSFDPTKGHGSDIITAKSFEDFDLSVDFKISEGGNSGIKCFLLPNTTLGCEFQIIDDSKHPDAKLGVAGNRQTGALYDLFPPAANKPFKGANEWNTAHIVSKGNHVEHWLNGKKILEYERGSEKFKQAIARSKFKDTQGFASATASPILLQAHGDKVWYRNVKIKEL